MLDYFLSAAVTLLIVIDPIGLAPFFLAATQNYSRAERRLVAWRSSIIALAILIVFGAVGAPLLGALGITLPAFRIAGGLLLFFISYEMVFSERTERSTDGVAEQGSARRKHLLYTSVFPIAIPLMAGPGAITAIILLAGEAHGDPLRLGGLLVITIAVITSCLAVYLAAGRVNRLLGVTGNAILSRLLGVILAALAVQYVIDGIRDAFLAAP
jgi:multiple antibiotic resistance protein